jgi:hypothetical protein
MTNFWRPLVLAAALNVVAGAGMAVAQTVVVTNAPAGENVELVLNATPLGAVVADERGDATLPVNLQKNLGKTEIDANIYEDVCEETHRVLIVERGGQLPAAPAGCERREVSGLYWVRQVSTVVVDVGGTIPSVLLIRGSYNPREANVARPARVAPTGLVVTGGGGLVSYRDAVLIGCGNVSDCSGKGMRIGFTGGAEFWLNRFLAAEGTYVRPSNVTVKGSGEGYNFTSSTATHLFTIAGKAGGPVGPTRLYGRAGANYLRATSSTSDTIDDRTITVDGVEQTIKGGTQTFELKTQGWGWLFGGGFEVWVSQSAALYADLSFTKLRGKEKGDGDGRLNDRLMLFFAGIRVHIGG